MIFLIEKNMRVERYSTGNDLNHEQISGQDEICTPWSTATVQQVNIINGLAHNRVQHKVQHVADRVAGLMRLSC